jgi:ubiquitin-conjugating enzyme E2 J1
VLPPEYPFKPPTFAFLTARRARAPQAPTRRCPRPFSAPLPHAAPRHAHATPQPNGRFEVNTKICLSISTHHPEHWQPSWSLRTALVALTAFFPTKGDGAIGALDYTPEARAAAAAREAEAAAAAAAAQRVC